MFFLVMKAKIKRTFFGRKYVYFYLNVSENFKRTWTDDPSKATKFLDKLWAERNCIDVEESAIAHGYL